jgi:hypothetical protein
MAARQAPRPVTGGVHGYETSGVQSLRLQTKAQDYAKTSTSLVLHV